MKSLLIATMIIAALFIGCADEHTTINQSSPEFINQFQVGLTYTFVTESGISPADTTKSRLMHIEFIQCSTDSVWHWMEFAGDDGQMFYVYNSDIR